MDYLVGMGQSMSINVNHIVGMLAMEAMECPTQPDPRLISAARFCVELRSKAVASSRTCWRGRQVHLPSCSS